MCFQFFIVILLLWHRIIIVCERVQTQEHSSIFLLEIMQNRINL